jgi:hypothetical protein
MAMACFRIFTGLPEALLIMSPWLNSRDTLPTLRACFLSNFPMPDSLASLQPGLQGKLCSRKGQSLGFRPQRGGKNVPQLLPGA